MLWNQLLWEKRVGTGFSFVGSWSTKCFEQNAMPVFLRTGIKISTPEFIQAFLSFGYLTADGSGKNSTAFIYRFCLSYLGICEVYLLFRESFLQPTATQWEWTIVKRQYHRVIYVFCLPLETSKQNMPKISHFLGNARFQSDEVNVKTVTEQTFVILRIETLTLFFNLRSNMEYTVSSSITYTKA